jgi:hypothetical protein
VKNQNDELRNPVGVGILSDMDPRVGLVPRPTLG